ncbi:hypothetical protein BAE44_0022819 [Dichanthelium oligosanthes]|uniref:Protein FAR1-RELATED SEQUENCE n=1 Tax=Dichanthelium oligosanthes TaxID=888268 RepID=A0A1E5UTB9_9POAL|nr:hypothetical protein BAE44_0022819 [Dichanthelium oligosanthes]
MKRMAYWVRNRMATGAQHRDRIGAKKSALQEALMKFGDRTTDYVIDPVIGIEFDDRQEAYDYYNLYSWEIGFGIRWGKKGKPGPNVKTAATLTDCPALLRLGHQCRAMEVAIAGEWKQTIHRWCKWHVLRRVRECIGTQYTQICEFRDEFHKMLNEMMTPEEFESGWEELLGRYGLSENAFLKQIYETREMWVKSYFKGVFCERMNSTQRSESANNMLKNIVPPNASLHQFVQQYGKLQFIRDQEENNEERRSKLNNMCKSTGGPLVMDAYKIYTPNVPNVFDLFCELKDGSEFYKVLISTGVDNLPGELVMKRWTKKAGLDVPDHLTEYTKENPVVRALTSSHSSLMVRVLKFVEMADSNVESHKMAMEIIDSGIDSLEPISQVKDGFGLGHCPAPETQDEDDGFLDRFPQRVPKKRASPEGISPRTKAIPKGLDSAAYAKVTSTTS